MRNYSITSLITGFPGGSVVKNPPANVEDAGDVGSILGLEDPLEEERAIHFGILAEIIQWTEKSGCKESDTTERLSTHAA